MNDPTSPDPLAGRDEGPAADRAGGLVLVADGIGGLDICAASLLRIVPRSGLPLEVRAVRWGHGFGRWLADLTRTANVEHHASLAAAQVAAFRERCPGAPVFLVGKSGGSGVVIKALEALPEQSVERAVLLAPAVSPGYDLTRALASLRRELVVYSSLLDFALLGAGTWAFGTIDRVRGVGAGLLGFRVPGPDAEPTRRAQYEKLRQVRWKPAMARVAYFGGHLAVDLPPFLRRYVIPLLEAGPVDLDEVLRGRAGRDPGLTGRSAATAPGPPNS